MQSESTKFSKLIFNNFQKHKNKTIDLSPNVTTILGDSESGKTSLFRGLRWVFFNKPNGTKFIRRQSKTKKCFVKIKFGDNTIKRIRHGKTNAVFINGKKFEAFGANPSRYIEKVCPIGEANFQNQHDGPKWFTMSAGQVAKKLNEIVDLSFLDKLQKAVKSKTNKTKIELEVHKEERTKTRKTIKELEWVENCEQEWKVIQKLKERQEDIEDQLASLNKGVIAYKKLMEFNSIKDSFEKDAATLTKLKTKRDKVTEQIGELSDFLDIKTSLTTEMKTWQRKLKRLKKKSKRCPTCGQIVS